VIAIEQLVMLALDELDEAEATAVESHILACGECAARFERLWRLTSVIGEILRSGQMSFPVTTAFADELRAAGLISRSYRLSPERIVPCEVSAEDIYSLTTLEAKLDDVEQVDLVVSLPTGTIRMEDVPFDRERGLVGYVTPSSRLRLLPSGRVTIDLLAMSAAGERRVGRFFLEHTAFAGA
jgi:hypothetical protein